MNIRQTLFAFILIATTVCAQQARTPNPEPAKPQATQSKADPSRPEIPPIHTSIVITASPIEPEIDYLNAEVFQQTLFSRDDQVFHQLNGGINAGQHEGGGKSIEVRRFGFNLDHGGVNGGLKVLVDNVQQNQSTQGHGQGYLGSLKSMSPELVDDAKLINGPFSAEYGDFSGLGVVHIRLRESLPDQLTIRMQGGSFNSQRGFIAWSPQWKATDSFFAYEGSHTDGPFVKPLDYRRDNFTANITRRIDERRSFAVKMNGGLNRYDSSGQIPLYLVDSGQLDRFGYLDNGEGGDIKAGTIGGYYRQESGDGSVWKVDGFLTRSLFDLFSDFTFYLNDPINGDGIQQHDSRLTEGANAQYLKPHKFGLVTGYLATGGNYHDNQINVGLYPRVGRTPLGVTTRANARVTNGAGYAQETLVMLGGKLTASGGLRYDAFRFDVQDRVDPEQSGVESQGRWQPKASVAYQPTRRIPITFHADYGRGISSVDARSILTDRDGTKVATTDFTEAGFSSSFGRFALSADAFLIDRSNELVYIADDGSLEFMGPSRAYGWEAKTAVSITSYLSVNGGITKVTNAFYKATDPREYVDRAPHFVANAGLTLAGWKGWSGSVRMRAINSYRLDGVDPAIRAAGHTVFDMSLVRRITRNVDFNFAIDNFTDRAYYETQNYLESRPYRDGPAAEGIHGTPGYPVTFTIGMTFRFGGK